MSSRICSNGVNIVGEPEWNERQKSLKRFQVARKNCSSIILQLCAKAGKEILRFLNG